MLTPFLPTPNTPQGLTPALFGWAGQPRHCGQAESQSAEIADFTLKLLSYLPSHSNLLQLLPHKAEGIAA